MAYLLDETTELMQRAKTREFAICHPDRPHYSRGRCRRCFDYERFHGHPPVDVPETVWQTIRADFGVPPKAKRLADGERRYIRLERASVAQHVAGVIVKNAMDTQAAAAELKPDLPEFEQNIVAAQLENSPEVKVAVAEELKKRGLDEESKQHFVSKLWQWFESDDPRYEKAKLAAIRQLGKVFLPERSWMEVGKLEPLPITGFDDNVRRMLGGDDSSQTDLGFSDATRYAASMDGDLDI